jgi:hypothetical protein
LSEAGRDIQEKFPWHWIDIAIECDPMLACVEVDKHLNTKRGLRMLLARLPYIYKVQPVLFPAAMERWLKIARPKSRKLLVDWLARRGMTPS